MKRLFQFLSFAALAALAVACAAADRDEAKQLQAFQPKGDAILPSAIIIKGQQYRPGQTYSGGLSALFPRNKLPRWILFWLS